MTPHDDRFIPLHHVPADQFAASEAALPGETEIDPAAEARADNAATAVRAVLTLLDLMQRDAKLARGLVLKLASAYATGCAYMPELVLKLASGQQLPGPLELAERYNITKQAVSADILAACAKLSKIDPLLANELAAARDFYRPGLAQSIAPKFKVEAHPIPRSQRTGEFVMMVAGKTFRVRLGFRGDTHIAMRLDGKGEIEGPFEWCVEVSAEGTMRGDGWIRVAKADAGKGGAR